jgi:hypothetical protein
MDSDLVMEATMMLNNARQRSVKHNMLYDLEVEWLVNKMKGGRCELTNIDFDYGENRLRPSLDRINPHKGYTMTNCRLVLKIMNFWKLDYTDNEIYEVAKAFVEKYENERISGQNT